jgi:hypothetical protein
MEALRNWNVSPESYLHKMKWGDIFRIDQVRENMSNAVDAHAIDTIRGRNRAPSRLSKRALRTLQKDIALLLRHVDALED